MDQTVLQAEQIPDTIIIKRILAGEKKLFEYLMRRYNQRLFRTGMSILNNDIETEDAMQTSYIQAYENLKKFENRSSFSTWLTRIMLNESLAQKRKKLRSRIELIDRPENKNYMTTPAHALMNKELGAALENAVAQLPEKYRIVFVLREIEDMSVKETSETLNIAVPNVKVRLNRAKIMLRENLHGYMKDSVYNFHLTRCNRVVANVCVHLGI